MLEKLRKALSAADAMTIVSHLRTGIDLLALLRHAHQTAVSLTERQMADVDLSFTQWSALWLLREGYVCNAGDVGRLLRLSSGATTRLIDGLEARHLLQRTRSDTDRRVVILFLTCQGDSLVVRSSSAIACAWQALLKPSGTDGGSPLMKALDELSSRCGNSLAKVD